MKKKKIAIFHNIISPHIIPLFEKLARQKDIEVKIFFCSETETNRIWKADVGDKFDYKILPKWQIELRGKDLFTYFINPTIIPELVKYNPDVIISAGWDIFAYQIAFLYAKLFRKKFILWSGSTKYEKSWRRTIALPLVKLMVWGSDAYIAYGTRAKEYLISLGAKAEKIFIAYNTIDVDFFQKEVEKWKEQKSKIKKQLGIKTAKTVLYVGQLIERKGVKYLIEGFGKFKKEFKDVSLLIAGYGPQENGLKKLAKRKKISDVIFPGGVDWKESPKFYAISDVFVLPSLEEVWGLVINEAMAAGLPVIGTSVAGASADLIKQGENGFIIKSASVMEVYQALKKILTSEQERERMSKISLKLIKNFTYMRAIEGIKDSIKFIGQ